jgi:tetratricopeptide (TPR) repeat protein
MRSLRFLGIVSFALLIGSNPKYGVIAQDSQIADTEAELDENDRMINTEIQFNDNAQIIETETQNTEIVEEANAEADDMEDEGILEHLNTLLENRGSAGDVIETIARLPSKLIAKLPYQICLARAYVQVGRSEEAEEILLMCMRDYPPSVEVARLLGSYYLQNQKYDDAEKYFNLTLEMEPTNWKALAGLGKLLLVRDSDKVRARDYLLEAIRIMPDDENLRFELAMVLFHFDDHMPAKAAIEVAEKLNPQIDYKVRETIEHLISKSYPS